MKMPTLTDEYRRVLKERFADTRTDDLARELGVAYRTLCRWAADMGLEKSSEFREAMSAIAGNTCNKKRARHGRNGKCKVLDDGRLLLMERYFATTPNKAMARMLGVNDRTVRRWASAMGLRKDAEVIVMHARCRMRPSPEEWFRVVSIISELFPDGNDKEIERLTGYSRNYIYCIATKYGIRRSEAYKERVRKTSSERMKILGFKRAKSARMLEMEKVMRKLYADTPTKEIAEMLGISLVYAKIIASRLGLRKDRTYVSRMRSEYMKIWHRRKKDT